MSEHVDDAPIEPEAGSYEVIESKPNVPAVWALVVMVSVACLSLTTCSAVYDWRFVEKTRAENGCVR